MVLEKLSGEGKKNRSGGGGASGDPEVSVIGANMKVFGDCETGGRLRIEGRIAGSVRAGELEIASSGSVDGDVIAGKGGGSAVRVDGSVTGAVQGGRVEVGPNGTVEGGITADEALVHGRVTGGVLARDRLVLEETAEVTGDLRARRLALREGGRIDGDVRMGEEAVRAGSEGPPSAVGSSADEEENRRYGPGVDPEDGGAEPGEEDPDATPPDEGEEEEGGRDREGREST